MEVLTLLKLRHLYNDVYRIMKISTSLGKPFEAMYNCLNSLHINRYYFNNNIYKYKIYAFISYQDKSIIALNIRDKIYEYVIVETFKMTV